VCNNIPRAVAKILENEKPKTPKKKERAKKGKKDSALVKTLSNLPGDELKQSQEENEEDPSQIDSVEQTINVEEQDVKKRGSPSDSLKSPEKMTPAKKQKFMQDIKFCGFSISF
jgi:hypothetical protein